MSNFQFKCTVLTYGKIPPAAGNSRNKYLLKNGREQLLIADKEFDSAYEILAFWGNKYDLKIPCNKIDDTELLRSLWSKVLNKIPNSSLLQIKNHISLSESASVNAFNFLEDSIYANDAHKKIHRAGFVRSGLFGCPIYIENDLIWTNCKTTLCHIRLGVSAGLNSIFLCSICGEEIEDCSHFEGNYYEKKCINVDVCNICKESSCLHEHGVFYKVQAFGIGKIIKLNEISLVQRPRYPLSRITERTVEISPEEIEMVEKSVLHCDSCLVKCSIEY